MSERPLAERSAACSERGRRPVNEDAVLVATLADGAELAAVADGLGGYAAGEIASRRAVEAVSAELESGADLVSAVRAANHAIIAEAARNAEQEGMSTTLVALLRRGAEYWIANVGDSRAYRVDERGIRQLTDDHSFLADAVRSGQLSLEDAQKSRWRNALTRALGSDAQLDVDCHGPFRTDEPHLVVICTDGVYRAVPDAELRRLAVAAPGLQEAAAAIVAAAHHAGSDDNMSVALVQFGATTTPARTSRAGEAPAEAAAAGDRPMGGQDAVPLTARAEPHRVLGLSGHQRAGRRRSGLGRWTSPGKLYILIGIIALIVVLIMRAL